MKNSNEMMESLLQRRDRYIAIKERKNRTIQRVVVPLCSICLVALIGVGFWKGPAVVDAGTRLINPRYRNTKFWKYDAATENEKIIEKNKVALTVESLETEKKGTQALTYEVSTETKSGEMDVYVDSKKNEYWYDKAGNFLIYRLSFNNTDEILPGEEACSEEESIRLAHAYIKRLFGERADGMEAYYTSKAGVYTGYEVYFARKYGVDNFIIGSGARAEVRQTGTLHNAFMSRDLKDDFNEKCVKNLTKETVLAQVMPEFEKRVENYVPESVRVKGIYLERHEDGFRLRVNIDYEVKEAGAFFEDIYYDLY